jgi:hypothetical protein
MVSSQPPTPHESDIEVDTPSQQPTSAHTINMNREKTPTFPSAQLVIFSTGSSERWIEVVHIQCGKPSVATTAQKANMMKRRVQMVLTFSGGGEYGFASMRGFDALEMISFSCDGSTIVAARCQMVALLL